MDTSTPNPVFAAPPGGKLTAGMTSAFDANGFLVLEGFIDPDACATLRTRALELVAAFDPAEVRSVFTTTAREQHADRYFLGSGDRIRFFLEAGAFSEDGALRQSKEDSLNKMGHALHDLDPVFDRFSHTPALAEVARRLGVRDAGVLQSMYIFKPPRIGGEVVYHQDSTYIYTEPESCLGFWFALEDATRENGCLWFIPGGHKGPLRERSHRSGDDSLVLEVLDETPFDEACAVAVEAKTGTLVVFAGRAPHYSAPNRSARSRHAYTLHVIDRRCHYPADNWLQRGADMPLRGFA